MLNVLRNIVVVIVLVVLLTGCDNPMGAVNVSSQFNTEVVSIDYDRAVPYLTIVVDVIPKDTFTGEPFKTVNLAGKTVTQSSPVVWLAVTSKDGHYFGNVGPLTWTQDELRLLDESERSYPAIQAVEKKRAKRVVVKSISRTDKDVVAMYSELGTFGAQDFQVIGKFNKYFDLIVVEEKRLLELRGGRQE